MFHNIGVSQHQSSILSCQNEHAVEFSTIFKQFKKKLQQDNTRIVEAGADGNTQT